MKIAIVHNSVSTAANPDEADVYLQVNAVSDALKALHYEPVSLSCTLNLEEVKGKLLQMRPDRVFNLVESLDGKDRLAHLFPSLLEAMNISYTGATATAILLTSNKIIAKNIMREKNINTPLYVAASGLLPEETCRDKSRWLLKSVWDHASAGIDEDSLIEDTTPADMAEVVIQKTRESGKEWFAEEYIDGREFNLSILQGPEGPMVLPPAEILFSGYPSSKPKIVGYRAKWESNSFEYRNTTRSFDFPPIDHPLLEELKRIALLCWISFDLSGYARVDFRIDHNGRPWVLEINSNPCLSPDAGFAAALDRSGVGFIKGIDHIINQYPRRLIRQQNTAIDKKRPDPGTVSRLNDPIEFRYEVEPVDPSVIEDITRKTGFFRDDEIEIAVELAEERLKKGPESGYHFVFALSGKKIAGYTCYGPIPCTLSSFDLYWIAVYPEFQNMGIGKQLLDETERLVRKNNGLRIYIETSHKEEYQSTRSFYTRCGYTPASLLPDFYSPGDSKATYCKALLSGG